MNPVSWGVATISAVVVASEQSLRHFAELWRARGGNAGVTVLLPSERLCAVAVSLGFSNPVNTAGADAQTLAALIGRMEQREYDG